MTGLSVVIPTLGRPTLARVLDGFEQQRVRGQPFEVVIVVDAAAARSGALGELIGERPYPVRTIAATMPGASAARNAGWRSASADLVLYIDDDTIPRPGLVTEHLSWHRRHPAEEVAVLGHVRWAPELRVSPFMRWLDHGIQFDYPSIRGTEAGWGRFYTAHVSVKASLIGRVGGFDEERFPFGYEDLEFAYRASKIGLRVLYNPRAVVDHLRPMTLEFWQRRVRRIAVAEHRFVSIYPEMPAYFHAMFSEALRFPPATGRGVSLLPYVPRGLPWIGARVWASADRYFKQAMAPHFLEAWAEAERRDGPETAQPDRSELDVSSSGGSIPGGPK